MLSIPGVELELLEIDEEDEEDSISATVTTSLGVRVGTPICKSLCPVTGIDELEDEEEITPQHGVGASPSVAICGHTAS